MRLRGRNSFFPDPSSGIVHVLRPAWPLRALKLLPTDGGVMEYFVPLFFVVLGIVLLTIAAKTIKIVPQATVMLIERLGRFSRVADSGLNVIVPFLDRPRAIYWSSSRPGMTSID